MMEWQKTVNREAGFRRCLILYGNVRDLWPTIDGRNLRLSQLITESLSDSFSIQGTWDGIDGLSFPNSSQLTAFNDLLDLSANVDEEGDDYEFENGGNSDDGGCAPVAYTDPMIAFPAMRQVLTGNSSKRSMFIIDWSEHLLTTPNQQDSDERNQLTNLAKAITELTPAQLSSTSFNSPTGLLVVITPNLGTLPPKFYNHDSRVKIVNIPTPNLEFRRNAITKMNRDFIIKDATSQNDSLNLLAEITDGMTMVDIRNMAALSRQSDTGLSIDDLVNLYRFGEKESPWTQLDEKKVAMARELICKRVKGQDEAVDRVVTMIIRAYLGLAGVQHSRKMTKPKGTLFFVGPTGVGKTELAKSVAEFIFGDENNCIRFDMSEFSQEHADQRLIGAPPGYVGFEEGGQLTNAVAEKPFSVLLFDEIEKAHPRVLDKFLQILEDGRLTDGRGQTVHFSETVIIFTSNIGASDADASKTYNDTKAHFMNAVQGHFNDTLGRPELLNRFGDNIIVFDFITDPSIRIKIMDAKLSGIRQHLLENFNLHLEIDDLHVQGLVGKGKVGHGGRGLINIIEQEIVNPMSLFIFERLHQIGDRTLKLFIDKGEDGKSRFSLKE
jgi:energy-coupling factor transporter ATP-binding protein EcfA2